MSDAPALNVTDPGAVKDHQAASQAAATTAQPAAPLSQPIPPSAAPSSQPGSPPVTPPGTAPAVAASPATPAATAVDTPVQLADGRQIPLSEVTAGYEAAVALNLNDRDTRDFLTLVHSAQQGDAAAMSQIEQIALANASPPVPGVESPVLPGVAPAVPGAIPSATVPALPATPTAPGGIDQAAIVESLRGLLMPIVDRIGKLEPYMQEQIQTGQIGSLKDAFASQKNLDGSLTYPNLSRSAEYSSPRVLQLWNEIIEHATKNKLARPNQHDLQRILVAEESYLASALPPPVQPATIVRDDGQPARIPGTPIPGRLGLPVPPAPPTASPVSTTMPLAGQPSPPMPIAPEAPVVNTRKALRSKIDADLQQVIGAQQRS